MDCGPISSIPDATLDCCFFNVANFNANSLLGHIDIVREFFADGRFHVISVSETWLHDNISSHCVSLNGYYLVRNDRIGKVGGGVGVFVHSSLKSKILASSPPQFSNSPEFLILEISLHGKKLLFSIIYRRPKGQLLDVFIDKFENLLHAYSEIIITGDLNCNLSSSNFEAKYLQDFIFSHSLYLIPYGNTHHTGSSDSWLDVVIVNSSQKIHSYVKSSAPFIAGHDLLEFQYKLLTPSRPTRLRKCRNFRNCDSIALKNDLCSIVTISPSDSSSDINKQAEFLCTSIVHVLDTHAPLITREFRGPPAGWFTPEIKRRISARNNLYTSAKRLKSADLMSQYRALRRAIKVEIKRAKNVYFNDRLSNLPNVSSVWRELGRLGLIVAKRPLASPLHHFGADQLNVFFILPSQMPILPVQPMS